MISVVVSLALAGAVATDDSIPIANRVFGVPWIVAMFTSMFWGPMLLGLPAAQLWLAVTEDGLNYGGRRVVPWSVVTAIKSHKVAVLGRPQIAFVLEGWRPSGWLARFMFTGAAPLEYFTPRWRSYGVTEAVSRWAPHVVIHDET